MKKLTTLIVALFLLFSLSAESPRVILGTGNDVLTIGLSRDVDDQRSFSLNTAVILGSKQITVDYESITNRGWRQRWSVYDETAQGNPDSWFSGRYDELRITASHEFKFNKESCVITIKPGLGIDASGNLGGQFLQNTFHEISNIHKVYIPYDQKTVVRPLISFDSSIEFSFGKFILKPTVRTMAVPMLRASESILIGASYYSLDFSLGYKFIQCKSSSDSNKLTAEELLSKYQSGPVFNLSFDGGFVIGEYTTSILTGSGFGKIGFDVMALFEKRKTDSPIKYKLGSKRELGKSYRLFEILFPIKNSLELVLSDCSMAWAFSSTPNGQLYVKEGNNGNLGTRYMWNNAFFMVGIKAKDYRREISPYISILGGCYKKEGSTLFNTISDTTHFNGEIIRSLIWEKSLSACAEIRTGIEIPLFRNLGVDFCTGMYCFIFSQNKNITPFYAISLVTK